MGVSPGFLERVLQFIELKPNFFKTDFRRGADLFTFGHAPYNPALFIAA
jgi:hypothetical protein